MSVLELSNYEFGDILGVGTVGTIYLATDLHTGEQVAVKKLHPRVSRDPLIRARFKREMTILERLRHPNIVSYLGGGREDDSLFFVMEVVHGGTVQNLLDSGGPLPWQAVVEISRQICSALQCAHNHGIVHRDLKPSNLFLTPEGVVKLGDFGIARDLTRADLSSDGVTVGTHAYMAPEQITGDLSVSGKVDLYALGCCIFEMLTDRKVFLGENYAQLFEQHLKQAPPKLRTLVPQCPEALEQIVFEMLAKKADDRPFNARLVQATMLEIAETAEAPETEKAKDDYSFHVGREQLVERIQKRFRPPAVDISWKRFALAGAIVVALIAVLSVVAAMTQ
ncbi:serine/threonine protein kinase [Stieleria varia]|uniref:Serine/threonine-protein kinase PknB n=1 Tax=Stieleria varia TaxID=2528005 RepID=A0A5C6B0M9_9BACT|nr:serine/threonine-protein kinase [Stieleria varia]TWU05723.1 Serine/threonine-protein kinase PknB [Stieleria varia]